MVLTDVACDIRRTIASALPKQHCMFFWGPRKWGGSLRRLVSVAVTKHFCLTVVSRCGALCCPDFPLPLPVAISRPACACNLKQRTKLQKKNELCKFLQTFVCISCKIHSVCAYLRFVRLFFHQKSLSRYVPLCCLPLSPSGNHLTSPWTVDS